MKQNNASTESTIDEQKSKKPKKEIIISVGIVTAIIGIGSIIIFKNRNTIKPLSFEETVKFITPIDDSKSTPVISETSKIREPLSCAPFPVKAHIRNLPKGCHASEKQMELAKSRGIDLDPDKTFVRPYMKRVS